MLNNPYPRRAKTAEVLCMVACLILGGCASTAGTKPEPVAEPSPRSSPEPVKPSDSERLMAERQRHCQEDKRRLELMLKENQKRTDELQKKLEALLAIDRDVHSRGKSH